MNRTAFAVAALVVATVSEMALARPAFDKSIFTRVLWAHHQVESITCAQGPSCFDRQLVRSGGDSVMDSVLLAHMLEDVGMKGVFVFGYPPSVLLDGFSRADNGRVAALVANVDSLADQPGDKSRSDEAVTAACYGYWREFMQRNSAVMRHPSYARAGSRPVIGLYAPGLNHLNRPQCFAEAVKRVEKEFFPCVWILIGDCCGEFKVMAPWIEVADGITWYSPQSLPMLKEYAEGMRTRFPEKVFMPNVRPKWQGANYGSAGVEAGVFTGIMRKVFDFALDVSPDGVCLNELAEFQEQSFVVPSYQTFDTWWRICREYSRRLRGLPLERKAPELVLSTRKDLLLGDWFECEILGFQVAGGSDVELDLRLADESGEEFYRFPKRKLALNKTGDVIFRAPTAGWTDRLAVIPELRYSFNGVESDPLWFRPTRLWVGNWPSDQIWSTPIDMAGKARVQSLWLTAIGKTPGFRVVKAGVPPAIDRIRARAKSHDMVFGGGIGVLEPTAAGVSWSHAAAGGPPVTGFNRYYWENAAMARTDHASEGALLVNGWSQRETAMLFTAPPPPVRFVEYESTRLGYVSVRWRDEDGTNREYMTAQPNGVEVSPPVTLVSDGALLADVPVQIAVADDAGIGAPRDMEAHGVNGRPLWPPVSDVRMLRVPKWRVPFFDYRFNDSCANVAFDSSGYEHHGWLGGDKLGNGPGTANSVSGYCFQNFGWTWTPPAKDTRPDAPQFVIDDDGTGCVEFDGKRTFGILPSRTQAPFSETIELLVKPEKTGREMALACSSVCISGGSGKEDRDIKQKICLSEDLRPFVLFPSNGLRVSGGEPLAVGRWSRIALVNDSARARLFVDGRLVAEGGPVPISNWFRSASYIALGVDMKANAHAYSTWPLDKADGFYKGRMRRVRVTARALAVDELL